MRWFRAKGKSAVRGEDLDYLYSALGHETRRAIVSSLGEEGVLSFTELMGKSGVGDTGTFGFHLKRTEALLDKLDDGRYQLTPLGQAAYGLLKFADMTAEGQAEVLQEPEEVRPELSEEGVRIVSDIETLLLDKDRLERYDHIAVHDCSEVIIDTDVDAGMFRNKVLEFRDVRRIVAPKHLYKLVLSRLEADVGNVESYEGEPPLERIVETKKRSENHLENYKENILDCSTLKPGTSISNFGTLTLRNLTKENLENISFRENYGVIRVPGGFKEPVLTKLTMSQNYGTVEEY